MTRTAWIFSYTEVARSPRVLRQAQALMESGWKVVVFGYETEETAAEAWQFVALPSISSSSKFITGWLRILRLFGLLLVTTAPIAGIRQAGARLYYGAIAHYLQAKNISKRFLLQNAALRPDLVICHDYFTTPVGHRIAEMTGARFTVDCHEYSRDECMDNQNWVKRVRPFAIALQDYYLAQADAVTTVCDGIANLLNQEQVLRRPVTVIRSVPAMPAMEYRPASDKIIVLYHGNISPSRDLEIAIQSLPMWRPEFHLVLRGYADALYVRQLEQLISNLGIGHRVTIEPPVAFADLISKANTADVGYFIHRDGSFQRRFALPNKFFEYITAGLALCVSDLPEMASILRQYKLGVLVPRADPDSVAQAINSLTLEKINLFKRQAVEAAQTLNWHSEKTRMLSLYEEILA